MSKKSFLSFKTRKDFLECEWLGLEVNREYRNIMALFCRGWAQKVIEISVILGIRWPALWPKVIGLRKTHQISCHFLWHTRKNGFCAQMEEWCVRSIPVRRKESCLKRPSVLNERQPSSHGHGLIYRDQCGKSLSPPRICGWNVYQVLETEDIKHYGKSLV